MTTKYYLIEDDVTEIIKTELYEHHKGKIDFTGPDSSRKIHIKTGLAGIQSIDNAVKRMMVNSGLVINASELNVFRTKTTSGISYTIPFLANVLFEVCPDFDKIVDIMIRGYSLDSYTYELYDDPNAKPFMKLVLGKAQYHIKGTSVVFMGGEYYSPDQAKIDFTERVKQVVPIFSSEVISRNNIDNKVKEFLKKEGIELTVFNKDNNG